MFNPLSIANIKYLPKIKKVHNNDHFTVMIKYMGIKILIRLFIFMTYYEVMREFVNF